MANYKCTFIFNAGRNGWSETWYNVQSSIEAAGTACKNLAAKRMALMGVGASIEAVRVSDEEVRGDSELNILDAVQPVYPSPIDPPWSAILARVESTALYRRQQWLRGVPDSWIQRNAITGINEAIGSFQQLYTNFIASLRVNGFCIKAYLKTGAGAVLWPIGAIGGPDAHGYMTMTIPGVTLAIGQTFLSSKWEGPDKKALNGTKRVVSVAGSVYTISQLYNTLEAPGANYNGKARPHIVTYQPIDYGEIVRLAKRATGRAFFVSAGRRKPRP